MYFAAPGKLPEQSHGFPSGLRSNLWAGEVSEKAPEDGPRAGEDEHADPTVPRPVIWDAVGRTG